MPHKLLLFIIIIIIIVTAYYFTKLFTKKTPIIESNTVSPPKHQVTIDTFQWPSQNIINHYNTLVEKKDKGWIGNFYIDSFTKKIKTLRENNNIINIYKKKIDEITNVHDCLKFRYELLHKFIEQQRAGRGNQGGNLEGKMGSIGYSK